MDQAEIVEQAKLPNIIVSCVLCAPGHNIATVAVVAIFTVSTRGTTEDLRTGGSLDSANLGSEMDFIGGGFTTIEHYNLCCVFR